ncbi:MAG: hypothetical protein AAB354_05195 [candidate division KSB1 bacterium]
MLSRKILKLSLALFVAACLLPACNHLVPCESGRFLPSGAQVWVEIMPVQCAGNVWQQEWIKEKGEYPLREQEEEVLRVFFRKRGVEFYAYREEGVFEVVCLACSCPMGYAARLLINTEDFSVFEQYGFKLASGNAAHCDDLPEGEIAFNANPHALEFGGSYFLHADSAKLVDERLQLRISYSGGCRTHEYELRLHRIENTVAYIFLYHHGNDDPCEAYVTVRLRADLHNFFMRDDWAKLVLLGPNGEQISLR